MKVPLCHLDEIPTEGTKMVDFFGREVLVYRVDGQPKAMLNICMHLGGPLTREGDRLICAWHGATFDGHCGTCLTGPAPVDSRLISLPTRAEHGVLHYVYGE